MNGGRPLKQCIINEITDFIEKRNKNDKNYFLSTDLDK